MATLTSAAVNVAPAAIPPPVVQNAGTSTHAKMKEKAQEFEAFYIQQFISLTRPDLSDNAIFGGGVGEQAFADHLDAQVGKAIAQRGGFGVADMVYAEMLKMQELQTPQPTESN